MSDEIVMTPAGPRVAPHRRSRFEYAFPGCNPAIWGAPDIDSGVFWVVFRGPPGVRVPVVLLIYPLSRRSPLWLAVCRNLGRVEVCTKLWPSPPFCARCWQRLFLPARQHILGCLIVLPVPGQFFFCRRSKPSPKPPGPSARAVGDRILVRPRWPQGQNRPQTLTGSPARGPE